MTSATLIEKCCLIASPVAGNPTHFMVEQAFLLAGLDWRFMSFEVDPKELGDAMRGIRALGFRGVKVAEPHQVTVLEYLDELTERARLCGSVNCVTSDGSRLLGDNTEGLALVDLVRSHVDLAGQRAMIIGAGRLARVIAVALAQAGVEVDHDRQPVARVGPAVGLATSRARPRLPRRSWNSASASAIKIAGDVTLLVNASSLSTDNPDAALPIELAAQPTGGVVVDVSYGSPSTWLTQQAAKRGCTVIDGVDLYVEQTALAFSTWTGVAAGQGRDARSGGRVFGTLARHVARTVHHRNGHGRRQDVCRRAHCAKAHCQRGNASASTNRWPAVANCATGRSIRPMRSRCGKRPADLGRSSKSARSGSPRRLRRISRPGPKADASIPSCCAPASNSGENRATSCSSKVPAD